MLSLTKQVGNWHYYFIRTYYGELECRCYNYESHSFRKEKEGQWWFEYGSLKNSVRRKGWTKKGKRKRRCGIVDIREHERRTWIEKTLPMSTCVDNLWPINTKYSNFTICRPFFTSKFFWWIIKERWKWGDISCLLHRWWFLD